MQVILGSQGVDDAHIGQAGDIDPADDRPLRAVAAQEAVQVVNLVDDGMRRGVVYARDLNPAGFTRQLDDFIVLDAGRRAGILLQLF
jgi:hypothetical protein